MKSHIKFRAAKTHFSFINIPVSIFIFEPYFVYKYGSLLIDTSRKTSHPECVSVTRLQFSVWWRSCHHHREYFILSSFSKAVGRCCTKKVAWKLTCDARPELESDSHCCPPTLLILVCMQICTLLITNPCWEG